MTDSNPSVVTDEPIRAPSPEVVADEAPQATEPAEHDSDPTPAGESAAAQDDSDAEGDDAEGEADEDEGQPGDDKPPRHGKKSWQKRVDKLTRQRADLERQLAEERGRRLALEELAKSKPQSTPEPDTPELPPEPQPEDYDSVEDYAKAYSKWERESEQAQAPAGSQEPSGAAFQPSHESLDIRQKSAEAAKAKFEDFETRLDALSGIVNPPMLAALEFDEDGAEIAYHLASNPDEAKRIAALPEAKVEAAIQRFARKYLGTTPPTPSPAAAGREGERTAQASRASGQPEAALTRASPVGTVLGGGRSTPERDLDDLDQEEYNRRMNQKFRGW